jgi:hypothetical protein
MAPAVDPEAQPGAQEIEAARLSRVFASTTADSDAGAFRGDS